MEGVKISCGRNDLGDFEKQIIDKLMAEYRSKIERHFDNIQFDLHVKCHMKEGNVKRFSVDVNVIVPGHRFEANSDEYKISDAVHKALEKIMTEIEHKMKLSNQGRSSRKPQNLKSRKI